MNKKNKNLQAIIEVAIFAAIAVALDMIQGGLFKGVFTSGGSIGLAMLPILVVSYRRGLGWGVLCGFIVSVLQMLSGIYAIQAANMPNDFLKACGPFLQVMLDYVLAYTVVGFAGAFSRMFKNGKTKGVKILAVILGCVLGGLLKYFCHVISGVVFWLNQGASWWGVGDSTAIYSWLYNGAYCIPNMVLCTIIMVIFAIFYEFILIPQDKVEKAQKSIKDDAMNAEASEVKGNE